MSCDSGYCSDPSWLSVTEPQSEPDYQQSAWKEFSGIHRQDSEVDHNIASASRGLSVSTHGRVSYLWPVGTFDTLEQEIMEYFPFTDGRPVPLALSTPSNSIKLNEPLPSTPTKSSNPVNLNKPLPPLPAEALVTINEPVWTGEYSKDPAESQSYPPESFGQPVWAKGYPGSGYVPSFSLDSIGQPVWMNDHPDSESVSSHGVYKGTCTTSKGTSAQTFPFIGDEYEEYKDEEDFDTFVTSSLFTKTRLIDEPETSDGETFSPESLSIYSPSHFRHHRCSPKRAFQPTYNTELIPVKSVVSGTVSIIRQVPKIVQVAEISLPDVSVRLNRPSSGRKYFNIGKIIGKVRGNGFLRRKQD
ncbi:hypothetical protein FHETE_7699 [Fusarium heterosporum]|uniref:Uncharacterized protein n=1 Tax=Fusarium heterosporum TaxID=42747 RepID=A0A8H5WLH1_FUSHE|nr:hypothetical protein FHETE_7699 [Fusarium heterosporum]